MASLQESKSQQGKFGHRQYDLGSIREQSEYRAV